MPDTRRSQRCQQAPANDVYADVKLAAPAIASLVIALGAPASALAAKRHTYVAPPGNSALTQYLEVVPTAAGPAPPSAHGGSHTSLSPGQRRELQQSGAAGTMLQAVVAATAWGTFGSGQARAGNGHPRSAGAGAATPSQPGAVSGAPAAAPSLRLARAAQSPVSALLAAATGSSDGGGIGILLPLLMVVCVVGAVVSVFARRRSSPGS